MVGLCKSITVQLKAKFYQQEAAWHQVQASQQAATPRACLPGSSLQIKGEKIALGAMVIIPQPFCSHSTVENGIKYSSHNFPEIPRQIMSHMHQKEMKRLILHKIGKGKCTHLSGVPWAAWEVMALVCIVVKRWGWWYILTSGWGFAWFDLTYGYHRKKHQTFLYRARRDKGSMSSESCQKPSIKNGVRLFST